MFLSKYIWGLNMTIEKQLLQGVLLITPPVFADNRGWFTESYTQYKFAENGIPAKFIQDNHSYSTQKGVLRGIHFQRDPKAQSKLVRCTRGAILDVAVDLRRGSDTYGKSVVVELSAENYKQLFIPKGFGHGFVTLTDDVEVQYKVDEYYSKEHDGGIRFDDPELDIDWGVGNPILSEKDTKLPLLKDAAPGFGLRVLVTGVNGQLGYDVIKQLETLGLTAKGVDIEDFDITDKNQVRDYLTSWMPDAVVHCAAYTAVDKAEDEKEKCSDINIEGTRNIAEVCRDLDAKMIYISTDYVFDGKGKDPHQEDAPPAPINYYGYSKEAGERIVRELVERYFIIRTSWVYGKNGTNFVKTMLQLAGKRKSLTVVDDQIGSPTYTRDLANLICDMLQTRKYGTYHGVNEGYCSWYEFACEIFRKEGVDVTVTPVPSEAYPTKAKRPVNSRLGKKLLVQNGFNRLPDWQDALDRYLSELKEDA